jgi:hypothetical protein
MKIKEANLFKIQLDVVFIKKTMVKSVIYLLFSYQTGYIMWHSRLMIYIPFGYKAFNLVKIHLFVRIIPLIQWNVMFCRSCFNRFWGLKYIPRLFSEYLMTFRVEEPMKICVTNEIRNIKYDFCQNYHHLQMYNKKYIVQIQQYLSSID